MKHFEKSIHKGEQYLERIRKENPKFEYDDFDFSRKDLFQGTNKSLNSSNNSSSE